MNNKKKEEKNVNNVEKKKKRVSHGIGNIRCPNRSFGCKKRFRFKDGHYFHHLKICRFNNFIPIDSEDSESISAEIDENDLEDEIDIDHINEKNDTNIMKSIDLNSKDIEYQIRKMRKLERDDLYIDDSDHEIDSDLEEYNSQNIYNDDSNGEEHEISQEDVLKIFDMNHHTSALSLYMNSSISWRDYSNYRNNLKKIIDISLHNIKLIPDISQKIYNEIEIIIKKNIIPNERTLRRDMENYFSLFKTELEDAYNNSFENNHNDISIFY